MIIVWILTFLAGAHPFPPSFATRENIWIHDMSEVNLKEIMTNRSFKIQHIFLTFWGHVLVFYVLLKYNNITLLAYTSILDFNYTHMY